jgi:hypothetical protein
MQFVYAMLNGLGHATEDHSVDHGFGPGSPDQVAFNAALAVIAGVQPKDEIEAMLAAHHGCHQYCVARIGCPYSWSYRQPHLRG